MAYRGRGRCIASRSSFNFDRQLTKERLMELHQERLPLFKLPPLLQIQVVEKLIFLDWLRLKSCSKSASLICDLIDARIPWRVGSLSIERPRVDDPDPLNYIGIHENPSDYHRWEMTTYTNYATASEIAAFPCKITASMIFIESYFPSEQAGETIEFFRTHQVVADIMEIEETVLCQVEQLVELAEVLGVYRIFFGRNPSPSSAFQNIFDFDYIRHLEQIDLDGVPITNEQLTLLPVKSVKLNGDLLNSDTINRYLKDWQDGKRELDRLFLKFNVESQQDVHEIDCDIANLVWSIESHDISLASHLVLEETREYSKEFPP